ncbi:MGDG synthase family glycosyltransferase [Acetivibrio cellulolyticus]|uniref:MGDG synthase family glycosyltransferase n=1 Tax=Acetivibrio cellulolyticus TaxID=35830 RepID=UPI0001E2D0A6|nr:glycosyltransferase [Acetivibrio cellulolyticus]
MAKNILIISSNYTGHGHKSITDSLLEKFSLNSDVNVHVIDGFTLLGNLGIRISKLYGSITRNAKEIWKMIWEISMKKPSIVNEFIEVSVRDSFLKLLKSVNPDLIVSVHPNFNGSLLNILEEYEIKIPFVTLIADLVSISPLWADPRVDYVICPTTESKYKCLEFGVSESKLKLIGFPVRQKFLQHLNADTPETTYNRNRPLECLIMSGGEGSGNMNTIASILLKNFNCRVKVVTGRNKVLKRRLERSLYERFGTDRVEVFGFTENIQELMLSSDLAITRGSPNVMMEVVACNVPLIVTGNLPGQEEGNPGYLLKHNLGVVCKETRKLKAITRELLINNASKLKQIKRSQKKFLNPNVAQEIADFILSIEGSGEVTIPDSSTRFWDISKKISIPERISLKKKIPVRRRRNF